MTEGELKFGLGKGPGAALLGIQEEASPADAVIPEESEQDAGKGGNAKVQKRAQAQLEQPGSPERRATLGLNLTRMMKDASTTPNPNTLYPKGCAGECFNDFGFSY